MRAIVAGTAGLELLKGECRELPPVKGMWGAVKLTGNALPQFTYLTFDGALMEFVTVRVNLALPNQISYNAEIQGQGLVTPEADYIEPFYRLAKYLAAYFPLLPPKREAETRAVF